MPLPSHPARAREGHCFCPQRPHLVNATLLCGLHHAGATKPRLPPIVESRRARLRASSVMSNPSTPLSPEQAERFLQEAKDFGIDVSLLRERLNLSPTERLEYHAQALTFAQDLRKAVHAKR